MTQTKTRRKRPPGNALMEAAQPTACGLATRFGLQGRVVFVSGAAGHLGRAMSFAFAEAGAHLILNGRTPSKLESLALELEAVGCSSTVAPFDVADEAKVRAFFGGCDRLDVLVNNAVSGLGSSGGGGGFQLIFDSGPVAAYRNVMSALPALEAAAAEVGQASVINVASIWGHLSPDPRMYAASGIETPPGYGVAKAGLMQLTRHLAVRLAPKRIRVNSLSPGIFPWRQVSEDMPDFVARASERSPMGRLGRPEEIGGPALFLASDASAYMTGADLVIDGGWTAW